MSTRDPFLASDFTDQTTVVRRPPSLPEALDDDTTTRPRSRSAPTITPGGDFVATFDDACTVVRAPPAPSRAARGAELRVVGAPSWKLDASPFSDPRSTERLILDTFRISAGHLAPLALGTVLAAAPTVLLWVTFGSAIAGRETSIALWMLGLGWLSATTVSVLWSATVVSATLAYVQGRALSLRAALRLVGTRLPAVFALEILRAIATFGGLLLFIVPGVLLWIGSILALPIMLAERCDPLAALSRAVELSTGHLLRLWIAVTVLGLCGATVGLVGILGGPLVLVTLLLATRFPLQPILCAIAYLRFRH